MTAQELATSLELYARYRDDNKGSALKAAAMLRQQAEQIEQLEVERLRLAGEVSNRNQRALEGDKSTAAFNTLYDEFEALRVERDALKADAERYRWLRALPIEAPQIGLDVVMWSKDDESVNSGIGIRLAGLDAAIDAMKGKS